VVVAAVALLLLGTACSHIPGMGSNGAPSPTPGGSATGTPLAKASGALDAQVPVPPGFPADVPVYASARLTAGASFTSTGQVAWGMEWETLDAAAKVQAFYVKQFGQGDWTLNPSNTTAGSYEATITRKSNSRDTGTLAINTDGGLTKILLSLTSTT
jgi:hypothetical protein